jgi:hypothetical protein
MINKQRRKQRRRTIKFAITGNEADITKLLDILARENMPGRMIWTNPKFNDEACLVELRDRSP